MKIMQDIRNYKEYKMTMGKAYLSTKVSVSYDCENQRAKPLGWTNYEKHNAQGQAVSSTTGDQVSDHWYYPRDFGGMMGSLIKMACAN